MNKIASAGIYFETGLSNAILECLSICKNAVFMTLRILSLTFNDLTLLNRGNPEINTGKSETDPKKLKARGFPLSLCEYY